MMAESYRTLAGRGRAAFEVAGSEFVGHAAPVHDVDDAEAFVEAVREKFDDATHNVPAYRVRRRSGGAGEDVAGERVRDVGDGGGFLREYQSDDGEPTGSAGKPALNVLVQQDIENVAVVVTRYYGGTNLGVGGLARAYSRAVKEAVADAGVVTERPHESVAIVVDYDDSGTVRGVLESAGVAFDADYGERVAFAARVPAAEADALRDRLLSATSGRVEFTDAHGTGTEDGTGGRE
jgi:putative IMPACT (imprinted ancient) family translation regulator